TVEETKKHLGSIQDVELVESYAISDAWISNFSKDCVSSMAREGEVDFGVRGPELHETTYPNRCLLAARHSQLS
nr:hypothetical protein [Tanacetum cinerariifolium]